MITIACRNVDAAQPSHNMTWADTYYPVHIKPGIVLAATFMRDRARVGDLMAVGGGGARDKLSGPAIELAAMADIPVYVGRIDIETMTRSSEIVEIVKARAAQISLIDRVSDISAAFKMLRAHGIRFYVAVAPELPSWDRTGEAATYHAGATYVYDDRSAD